jgi:hypothetical protein
VIPLSPSYSGKFSSLGRRTDNPLSDRRRLVIDMVQAVVDAADRVWYTSRNRSLDLVAYYPRRPNRGYAMARREGPHLTWADGLSSVVRRLGRQFKTAGVQRQYSGTAGRMLARSWRAGVEAAWAAGELAHGKDA